MKKLILVLLFVPLVCFGQTAEVYYNSGVSKVDLKDYYGAIADYSKAIELDPDDASAYYNRGIAKYYLDDINGACLDVRKSVNLGRTDSKDFIGQICN